MSFLYRKKVEPEKNILSFAKPKESILKINTRQQTEPKTKLKQKEKIVVYIENKKYFIEHAAAFSLGLINTRSIMLDAPKLVMRCIINYVQILK